MKVALEEIEEETLVNKECLMFLDMQTTRLFLRIVWKDCSKVAEESLRYGLEFNPKKYMVISKNQVN